MPIVEITMVEGRSPAMKRNLMRSVTDAITGSLSVPSDNVRVMISEIPKSHFAVGGEVKFNPVTEEVED